MRVLKRAAALVLVIGAVFAGTAKAQTGKPEELVQQVKLLIFDKEWARALAVSDVLIEKYPGTPQSREALFYRGESLSNLPGREREALKAYQAYIKTPGAAQGMGESAEASIIDLSFKLLEQGDDKAGEEILSRLSSPNKAVRYYAAYKLSQAGRRDISARAVPVLDRIIEEEQDPELLDRARIALLRVAPAKLKQAENRRSGLGSGMMLSIRIWDKHDRRNKAAITIPWALADLAIRAIPDDEKDSIRRQGYDLDRMLDDLVRSKDSLLKFEDEASLIEIRIEKR